MPHGLRNRLLSGVFARPDAFRTKLVSSERTANRIGDRLAFVHSIAGNLPKPAPVEVACRFLHGCVEQEEHDATAPPLEYPHVESVRGQIHGSSRASVCNGGECAARKTSRSLRPTPYRNRCSRRVGHWRPVYDIPRRTWRAPLPGGRAPQPAW